MEKRREADAHDETRGRKELAQLVFCGGKGETLILDSRVLCDE